MSTTASWEFPQLDPLLERKWMGRILTLKVNIDIIDDSIQRPDSSSGAVEDSSLRISNFLR